MSSNGKIFYGEASKGFILKVTIDTLCGPLQRGIFIIDKDGMRLRQTDIGNTVLYDVNFARKNFRGYKCSKPLVISVNLKHIQNLLRNVKKKDSLALFIKPGEEKFFFTIRPEGARKNTRFETNSVVYQEEKNYKLEPVPDGGYEFPMVIEATDFQKIKRLTTIGKIINLVIQKDNYLSFRCDAGVILDSELGFGELRSADPDADDDSGDEKSSKISPAATKTSTAIKTPTTATKTSGKCEFCNKSPKNCWCVCPADDSREEGCGEYLCDCICTCEKCDEYLCDCTCACAIDEHLSEDAADGYDKFEDEEIPDLFEAQYYSNILTKLVKLPGLCQQMQFYAPTTPGFPLRIEVNAGQGGFILGTIQVFIKDVAQISYEESVKNEEENIIIEKPKSKGKGKR